MWPRHLHQLPVSGDSGQTSVGAGILCRHVRQLVTRGSLLIFCSWLRRTSTCCADRVYMRSWPRPALWTASDVTRSCTAPSSWKTWSARKRRQGSRRACRQIWVRHTAVDCRLGQDRIGKVPLLRPGRPRVRSTVMINGAIGRAVMPHKGCMMPSQMCSRTLPRSRMVTTSM